MLTALVLQLIQCVVILPENLKSKSKDKEKETKDGEATPKDKINVRINFFLLMALVYKRRNKSLSFCLFSYGPLISLRSLNSFLVLTTSTKFSISLVA